MDKVPGSLPNPTSALKATARLGLPSAAHFHTHMPWHREPCSHGAYMARLMDTPPPQHEELGETGGGRGIMPAHWALGTCSSSSSCFPTLQQGSAETNLIVTDGPQSPVLEITALLQRSSSLQRCHPPQLVKVVPGLWLLKKPVYGFCLPSFPLCVIDTS